MNGQSHAATPCRISFAGGGTDVSPFPETYGGEVVNATISVQMRATLRLRTDRRAIIRTNRRPEALVYDDLRTWQFDGQLDFIKAITRKVHPCDIGFELSLQSAVPNRGGLGGSAAMAVAVLGAFNYFRLGRYYTPRELAETAHIIEVEDMGNPGGRQDQYAAALGGFNYMRFGGGANVDVRPLRLSAGSAGLNDLSGGMFLVSLGRRPLPSGAINGQVSKDMKDGNGTLAALQETKALVPQMVAALEQCDICQVGQLLDALWIIKKRFHPGVSNDRIDGIYDTLREAGMLGGKVTGAGGGGHMLVCFNREDRVRMIRTAADLGLPILPFVFTTDGLQMRAEPAVSD